MCGAGASRLVHDMSDWVAILGNLTTLLIDQLHVIYRNDSIPIHYGTL